MVIDLGNGLETNARLNLPAVGDGPYPGVLLVPGSGTTDMNETAGFYSHRQDRRQDISSGTVLPDS